jgi:hypothetical protein
LKRGTIARILFTVGKLLTILVAKKKTTFKKPTNEKDGQKCGFDIY